MAELSALELHMLLQLGYRLFVGEEEVAHRLREVKVCHKPQGACLLPFRKLFSFLHHRSLLAASRAHAFRLRGCVLCCYNRS